MLAVTIGLLIGILLPMQTSVNSRLRNSVGSPFAASFISFAIGTVFLIVLTLFVEGTLLIPSETFNQQPLWVWIGGSLGVIFLTGNILLFPRLGSVQTVIMPIFGQILMGLLIDHFGWFHSNVTSLTPTRVLGAGLVLLGVVGTVALTDWLNARRGKLVVQSNTSEKGNLNGWRLLGVGMGMMGAMQAAINGYLGVALDSTMKGALVSFVVGTLTLLIVLILVRPAVRLNNLSAGPWWMWLGGIIGAIFITSNVFIVPIVGTGVAVVIVIVGLLIGSLLIDRFGWFGAAKNPVTSVQVISLLVMVAGIVLIRLN